MLYPFFVAFGDADQEEVASSIIIAQDAEEAEALAMEVIEAEGLRGVAVVGIKPFTLDFINNTPGAESGVLLLEFAEEEEQNFFNKGERNFGFFN